MRPPVKKYLSVPRHILTAKNPWKTILRVHLGTHRNIKVQVDHIKNSTVKLLGGLTTEGGYMQPHVFGHALENSIF